MTDLGACGENDIGENDEGINTIKTEIFDVLQIHDDEKKVQIVNSLLKNGRQSLVAYQKDIIGRLYKKAIDINGSELLELLKRYFHEKWEKQYCSSYEWFSLFLKRCQNQDSPDMYESVLVRTAEYGNKYMKNCPILSIVLQILFEGINDECLRETTVFDDLWFTITSDGIKSIRKYDKYISKTAMNRQINDKQSALYQALRLYYYQELFLILKKIAVKNIDNLCRMASESIAENGWLKGIQSIKEEIAPKFYEILVAKIQSDQLKPPSQGVETEDKDDDDPQSKRTQSSSTLPKTGESDQCGQSLKLTIEDGECIYINDQVDNFIPFEESNQYPKPQYLSTQNPILYRQTDKRTMILTCKPKRINLFRLSDLVQAGELQYLNQKFDDIAQNLVDNLNRKHHSFPTFIQDCLTPIMYLLKRQQNLNDFFETLKTKYRQTEQPQKLTFSLRMILYILFMQSDPSLKRKIMSLLNKRNPAPFVFPSISKNNQIKQYEFMADIIHEWDVKRPTILSFGIGPCPGKTRLLNKVFQSKFESTNESIYFQETIDIDFGYSFNPKRILNIADTHGKIDKPLLEQIHSLFDGFLIQIETEYLKKHHQSLVRCIKMLPKDKFKMIIVRDIPTDDNRKCLTFVQSKLKEFQIELSEKLQIYPLVNISLADDDDIKFAIEEFRENLLKHIKSQVSVTNNERSIASTFQKLAKGIFIDNIGRLNKIIEVIKNQTSQKNSNQTRQNFPLYKKFQELCKLRQKLKKLDFYGPGSENMFGIYNELNSLENQLNSNTQTSVQIENGQIFDLFIDILKTPDMLMSLDLLSKELKSELLSLGADKIAGDLIIEHAFLSLEVLWRNTIVCYNRATNDIQNVITKSYYDYITAGFPFEIIDGDNLNFQHQFLTQVLKQFESQRILVISIIGPQNSGKSTLLNYMFGSFFDVRDGRCTRGVYGSLVKIDKSNRSVKTYMPNIDYIMLIDTEGLLSIEKSDPEYDRRLVLFCLAVSHLVIANIQSNIDEVFKSLLTLCADSLKHIGVNKVNQPIVHFVLNQRAVQNLDNQKEAINKIITDLKNDHLDQTIDISMDNFHTLPLAFSLERVSNDIDRPCFIRTEPNFIQSTQQLCEKIIQSAKSSYGRSVQAFSNPSQWLRAAVTVFDTLLKFPDLTYFKDINERQQDDRIKERIKTLVLDTLTPDYRDKTISELCERTEKDIQEQLQAKFNVHQDAFDDDLIATFETADVSERIRDRCTQFLKRQVTEIRNAWCIAAIQAHDKKQMEILVRDGSDDLRKLIDELIENGQIMTKENATEKFDILWHEKLRSIEGSFDEDRRLKHAVEFVYGNYNIFEKQCLPSHEYILDRLMIINELSKTSSMDVVIAEVEDYFAEDIRLQSLRTLKNVWKSSDENTTHTLATIKSFNHLNKNKIEDILEIGIRHQNEPSNQSSTSQKSGFSMFDIIKMSIGVFSDAFSRGESTRTWVQSATKIIRPVVLKLGFVQDVQSILCHEIECAPNEKSNILCLKNVFHKIITETAAIVQVNSPIRRPIELDVIRRIVDMINAIIKTVDDELIVFKLSFSKQTESSIHTFILILLIILYYHEQRQHFRQQMWTLEKEKPLLLTYFISMVVPDAQCDNEGAQFFVNKVTNTVHSRLFRNAQIIINTRINEKEKHISRKHIQHICDGKLLAAIDTDEWLFRYINAPTDIIIEEFQISWKLVENSINQEIEKEKMKWKNILIEFFNRIEFMISSLANEGSSVQFIDDIFEASAGTAADNLKNKGQCMILLLYDYLTGKKIQSGISYTVFDIRYTLKEKGFKLFGKLPKPNQELVNLINEVKNSDNSNNNRTKIASIKNLHMFLQSIINAKNATLDMYDETPATFAAHDKDQHYNKLLDKARGCTAKCPCCQRPCDVDHTLISSSSGDEDNRHCCQTGHQLRAMAGIKFEITNEASLFQCEQMTDNKLIVVRGTRKRWAEFKEDHPDWDFSNSITQSELFALRGKFLNVWGRIGKRLCKDYNMEFVIANTPEPVPKSFHYILLLDASGSMKDDPWKNLIDAVAEFIKIRIQVGASDFITIIVFNEEATYAYYNKDINSIDINQIKFTNGQTDFGKAFDLVIKTIESAETQKSVADSSEHLKYVIIFMSDGLAPFPLVQMEKLSIMKSMINQFWTVALGQTDMNILQAINTHMNGTFKSAKDNADLVPAYAEIARS